MEYVTSADGTRISYEVSGSGPPLVLVHGGFVDRMSWVFVGSEFKKHFTVFAMDRRGRGESGPICEHALERQFEDVVAVMRAAGEPVDLVGHSYGALCALGAAAMEPALVKHLVLYEPADRDLPGLEVVARFGQGDDSDALAMFLTEVAGEPRERVEELKKTPVWPYMLRFTSSAPFEKPALLGYDFNPANFAHVKAQALFLVGSETKEQLGRLLRELNTVMPAQWHTFEGQGHGAITAAPGEFSETVLEFLSR